MSVLEHLEELRWHLIRGLSAVAICAVVALCFPRFLFDEVLLAPIRKDFPTFQFFCWLSGQVGSDALCLQSDLFDEIQNRKVTGQFTLHIMSSFVAGIVVAFPYLFWEIWRFISPGLHDGERQNSRGAVFFVSLLFIMGAAFGYYFITPISMNFLANYQVSDHVKNFIEISSAVNTLLMMVLACAIIFQMPMAVYFLSKIEVVTPEAMRKYRRHAVVVTLFVNAVITPPDVMSQVLLSIPVLALYEMSILVSGRVQRKLAKQRAAAEARDQELRQKEEAERQREEEETYRIAPPSGSVGRED